MNDVVITDRSVMMIAACDVVIVILLVNLTEVKPISVRIHMQYQHRQLKIVGNKKKIASKIVKAVCENKNSVTILIVTIHTYTAASSCHIVAASLTEILPTFSSSWPAISSTSTSKKNDADKVALGKQMA